ncbi:zinc-binding alcohol dehydrogenase family protein [Kitasatospora phosalacinea]|uniref:zinc-binding alcohol dehydrogenase family protein n=1 Tax=Kitasatospora phosalacinea TaxID=2065 RepID=UPI000527F79E|nr:zinc-binding alcohol dehydrogenase family protein [Kitasatospora phosalacinea]
MTPRNTALWLPKPGAPFEVGPAPYTPPAAGEVVVRVRAVAVNPIDGIPGFLYRLALPWLSFPAVVGSDVAGEVVETGPAVTGLRRGDRVLGHAFGVDRSRNRPAEGAFQHYVVLMRHMVSPVPDALPFARAAVLPLALSTAATGLFQHDHLGLALPGADRGPGPDPGPGPGPADRGETVLVWGGSTSVGSNAIQLARNAGYRVVATASPHNFDHVRSLGAAHAVDRNSPTAVAELLELIGDGPLAGTLAIGAGSLRRTVPVAARAPGGGRIASAQPAVLTRLPGWLARRHGVRVSSIWGGTLKDNEVGPAVYTDFLPTALATGAYRAAPDAAVVGHGLAAVPDALRELKGGVRAKKLVVTL